jgi:hypothetical protein
MKKLLIIFSSICVFGCSSYSQNKKIVYNCTVIDTISQDEKFINIDNYKKELEEKRSALILENDSIKIQIFLSKTQNKISKHTENKNTNVVKEINYDYSSKKITSFYFYYYKNSVLLIGNEYHYDSLGNVIEVINNDDPENYALCYKEAEAIALKKMGKKYEIQALGRENKMINMEKVYYWEVITSKIGSFKYADKRKFWIHGKTGRIIKISKMYISTDDYFKENK